MTVLLTAWLRLISCRSVVVHPWLGGVRWGWTAVDALLVRNTWIHIKDCRGNTVSSSGYHERLFILCTRHQDHRLACIPSTLTNESLPWESAGEGTASCIRLQMETKSEKITSFWWMRRQCCVSSWVDATSERKMILNETLQYSLMYLGKRR